RSLPSGPWKVKSGAQAAARTPARPARFVVRLGRDGTPRRRRNRRRRLLRAAVRPRGDRNGGFPGEGPPGVRRALAAAGRGRLAREADDRRRRRRGREHRLLGTGGPAARRLLGRAGVLGRGLATAALAELVAEIPIGRSTPGSRRATSVRS